MMHSVAVLSLVVCCASLSPLPFGVIQGSFLLHSCLSPSDCYLQHLLCCKLCSSSKRIQSAADVWYRARALTYPWCSLKHGQPCGADHTLGSRVRSNRTRRASYAHMDGRLACMPPDTQQSSLTLVKCTSGCNLEKLMNAMVPYMQSEEADEFHGTIYAYMYPCKWCFRSGAGSRPLVSDTAQTDQSYNIDQ